MLSIKSKFSTTIQTLTDCQIEVVHKSADEDITQLLFIFHVLAYSEDLVFCFSFIWVAVLALFVFLCGRLVPHQLFPSTPLL